MKLERFAADQDVRLVPDALAAVEPDRRVAITACSGRLPYDALLICVGARPVRALPGAITFRGRRDAAALRAALDAVAPGEAATIAFAVPFGAFWTLPLYELALLAAARLHRRGTRGAGWSSPRRRRRRWRPSGRLPRARSLRCSTRAASSSRVARVRALPMRASSSSMTAAGSERRRS